MDAMLPRLTLEDSLARSESILTASEKTKNKPQASQRQSDAASKELTGTTLPDGQELHFSAEK